VSVPVSNLNAWEHAQNTLIELLTWLTDDIWEVSFRPRGPVFEPSPPGHLLLSRVERLCLFSGGVDSAAALAMAADSPGVTVPVSIATHSHFVGLQRRVFESMRPSFRPDTPTPLHVKLSIPHQCENSQRTRGLAYLGLAAVAAFAVRGSELIVGENGIGAINLPLLNGQYGPMMSRNTHPRTLVLAQVLLNKVMDHPVRLCLPYVFRTKRWMVNTLKEAGRGATLSETQSCDSFPRRQQPCGHCTSCLFNQIAVERLEGPGRISSAVERGAGAGTWYALERQADRLANRLRDPEPWPALAAEFPGLWDAHDGIVTLTGMAPNEVQSRLVGLYQDYLSEWQGFASAVGL